MTDAAEYSALSGRCKGRSGIGNQVQGSVISNQYIEDRLNINVLITRLLTDRMPEWVPPSR